MASNGPNTPHDDDRQRLLDEIRRRAEEAELKRIEDEERLAGTDAGRSAEDDASSPFPTLPNQFPHPGSLPADTDQRAVILRERLSIALDRGNTENAGDLLAELASIDPLDPSLKGFRDRLEQLEASVAVREPAPELPPIPAPPAVATPPPAPMAEEQPPTPVPEPEPPMMSGHLEERIGELLDTARSLYEQEKYENALQQLNQVLLLDESNREAEKLREQIERAWQLAEVIKREEERHRAEEPKLAPVQEPVIPPRATDADFWGPTEVAAERGGVLGMPEQAAPVLPKKAKPPSLDRIVSKVSRIKVPIRPILTVAGIAVVAVVAYLIVDALLTAVVPPDRVVCVFPSAVSGTGGVEERALADGLTDDIIRDLGSVTALRVVGPSTAFALRERSTRPVHLARGLAAGFFVVSDLTVSGDRIAGTFTLMDTVHAGAVLQSRLDCPIADLPVKRRELVRKILGAMAVEIPAGDDGLADPAGVQVSAGYRSYLLGRASMHQNDPEALDRGRDWFLQALREDSTLGDAWSALGWVSLLLIEQDPVPSSADLPPVMSCVQHAVASGANRAETFRVWGVLELMGRDYERATVRLQDAVDASPSDAEAVRRFALLLTLRGRSDASLRQALRAVALDPLNPASHTVEGLVHQFRGEFAEAEGAYRRALREDRTDAGAIGLHASVLVLLQQADQALTNITDLVSRNRTDPGAFYQLGRFAQTAGRPKEEWMSALQRARLLLQEELRARPDNAPALALLALTQTRLGEFREAGVAMERALAIAPDDVRVVYAAARMHALQRDKAGAMAYLSQALELRYDLRAVVDMDLFNLRADEEFIRSVTR